MTVNSIKLFEKMLEKELTQAQVAEVTGLSSLSVRKAINGEKVTLKVIAKLAKGLDIPPHELIKFGD